MFTRPRTRPLLALALLPVAGVVALGTSGFSAAADRTPTAPVQAVPSSTHPEPEPGDDSGGRGGRSGSGRHGGSDDGPGHS